MMSSLLFIAGGFLVINKVECPFSALEPSIFLTTSSKEDESLRIDTQSHYGREKVTSASVTQCGIRKCE